MTYQQCHEQRNRVGVVVVTGEAGVNATTALDATNETWIAREV